MSESNTPDAIKARAAEVDAMIRGFSAPAPNNGGVDGAGSEQASATPAPTDTGGAGMQPAPEKAAPPVDDTPPPPNEVEQLRQQLTKMENDLRTWRGRYDAELPRERDARARLEAELESLRDRIAEAPKQEQEQAPEYALPSKDELSNYGEDLFEIAKRFIMPDVHKSLAALEARLAKRIESLNKDVGTAKTQVAQTAKDRFVERLTTAVPDWQKVDTSAEFNDWLDQIDPLYNLPRRNALDTAVQNLNDEHTARIFTAFLSQQGAGGSQSTKVSGPTPASGTEPSVATAQQPASGPTLEDFAAPGKPSPSQTPEPAKPGAKVWTVAEIQSFYREVSRGAYRSRPDEKDRIERDIAEAQKEGRVKPA
jgi:hypothetical protein